MHYGWRMVAELPSEKIRVLQKLCGCRNGRIMVKASTWKLHKLFPWSFERMDRFPLPVKQ